MILINVSEAAKRLNVSQQMIRNLCDQKKIISVRPSGNPSGKRVIVEESLNRYMESLLADAPPEFIPQRTVWDDSDAELDKLLAFVKKRRSR